MEWQPHKGTPGNWTVPESHSERTYNTALAVFEAKDFEIDFNSTKRSSVRINALLVGTLLLNGVSHAEIRKYTKKGSTWSYHQETTHLHMSRIDEEYRTDFEKVKSLKL